MDSEVKMFLLIRRVLFCLGYVLTQLLYVTELNISRIAPLMISSSMIGWPWGWRSLELDGTMGSHDASET